MRPEKRSQPQIKNGDILLTMIGLLALGKSDFENVNEFHKDEEFYKIALGIAYACASQHYQAQKDPNSDRQSDPDCRSFDRSRPKIKNVTRAL